MILVPMTRSMLKRLLCLFAGRFRYTSSLLLKSKFDSLDPQGRAELYNAGKGKLLLSRPTGLPRSTGKTTSGMSFHCSLTAR